MINLFVFDDNRRLLQGDYSITGCLGHILMKVFGHLPLRNVFVFSAFEGKIYGDNPRAIYEEMLRRDLPVKYIWLLRDKSLKVPGATTVKPNSIRGAYYLSVARLWVDCTRKSEWVIKRDGQLYVQTWHGDIGVKRVEKDAVDALSRQYINAAIHDSQLVDLMISGSKFGTELYKRAFWYRGEILELGNPKSDSLFCDKSIVRSKVRESLGIPATCKIVTYLPTFRSDGSSRAYFNDYEGLVRSLTKRFEGDWMAVEKLHPNVVLNQNDIDKASRNYVDARSIQSTNELIAASDLIITDYSSCMFDALEIDIPTILYTSDLDEYSKERGFYFNLADLPFPVVRSDEELFKLIGCFDFAEYSRNASSFKNGISSFNDGHSAARVVDEILSRLQVSFAI